MLLLSQPCNCCNVWLQCSNRFEHSLASVTQSAQEKKASRRVAAKHCCDAEDKAAQKKRKKKTKAAAVRKGGKKRCLSDHIRLWAENHTTLAIRVKRHPPGALRVGDCFCCFLGRGGAQVKLTSAASSPRTCAPCPPWTGWWSAWSSWSDSPWRPGSTRCLPEFPSCPRNGTGWCADAGRCRAAGPGCRGGCSSEPVWGFGRGAPPARGREVGDQTQGVGAKERTRRGGVDAVQEYIEVKRLKIGQFCCNCVKTQPPRKKVWLMMITEFIIII